MIKVKPALKIVLKNVSPIGAETVKITESLGRALAQDIRSDSDIPGFDNSAMDGYAVKSFDTVGAAKNKAIIFKVIGELRAGEVPKKILNRNEVMRIMTGATIPEGADSVIKAEDTRKIKIQKSKFKNKEFIGILKETKSGENIRRAGEDIKRGELVIKKGTLLKSAHVGVLASLGKTNVRVTRKPKVAVLATGDEVVELNRKLAPGKLRNSNTYALCSQIINCGGVPKNLGIVKDQARALESRLKEALDCDLILTSGGVSVGEYDLVKFILAKMGTNIKFWQVAMRPGKPLVFGTIKGIPVFGLPGNPVSAMMSFEIFARPAILKMLGHDPGDKNEVAAVLQEDITKKKGLRYFIRAKTVWKDGIYLTRSTGPQGSGILKSMILANSLIIFPEEEGFVKKGSRVTVRFFD